MAFKQRITSFVFLLIFLSAWMPSAIAHAVDPHHDDATDVQTELHESDHCPYCDLDLAAFTPFQPAFFTVVTQVEVLSPVEYIPSFSIAETSLVSSRGPPAC